MKLSVYKIEAIVKLKLKLILKPSQKGNDLSEEDNKTNKL